MDYTLSGKRTVNGNLQTGIAMIRNTAVSTSQTAVMNKLRDWIAILSAFDGTRTVSNLVLYNYNEFDSDNEGNGFGKADITFSVLGSLSDGNLKSLTAKVEGVTLANAATTIQAKVTALAGIDLTTSLAYTVTNAVFILHS